MGCQKAKWMLRIIGEVQAIKLRVCRPVLTIVSQNVAESSSITTEDKNIILEAYSTPKLGSGGNFESRKSSLRHMVYLCLIKLTQPKDAYL